MLSAKCSLSEYLARISDTYAAANFGLVEIDWEAKPSPMVALKVIGIDGEAVIEHGIRLNDLSRSFEH